MVSQDFDRGGEFMCARVCGGWPTLNLKQDNSVRTKRMNAGEEWRDTSYVVREVRYNNQSFWQLFFPSKCLDPSLVASSLHSVVPDATDVVDVDFAIDDRHSLATDIVWCTSTEEW
jgi:hypothetical protein